MAGMEQRRGRIRSWRQDERREADRSTALAAAEAAFATGTGADTGGRHLAAALRRERSRMGGKAGYDVARHLALARALALVRRTDGGIGPDKTKAPPR